MAMQKRRTAKGTPRSIEEELQAFVAVDYRLARS